MGSESRESRPSFRELTLLLVRCGLVRQPTRDQIGKRDESHARQKSGQQVDLPENHELNQHIQGDREEERARDGFEPFTQNLAALVTGRCDEFQEIGRRAGLRIELTIAESQGDGNRRLQDVSEVSRSAEELRQVGKKLLRENVHIVTHPDGCGG